MPSPESPRHRRYFPTLKDVMREFLKLADWERILGGEVQQEVEPGR
jgi:hypothetical protein